MKKIKQAMVVSVILITLSLGAFSQTSTSKTEKIKTLMELTGSAKQYKQMMDVMINSVAKTSPTLPKEFLESFVKEIDFNGLINEMAPIYDKHFTETDIDGLITFYQSEVGKKMIDKMPIIMAEYMPLVQVKMKAVTERLIKAMQEQQEKDKKP